MMKSKLQMSLVVAFTVMFVGLLASPIYAQSDNIRFQAKNTGFGITDIDKDGFSEILMFDDNTGFVRVFEATAANTYEFVAEWQPNPDGWRTGATVKSQIPQADFDVDGVFELYLSDTKGNTWIITPGGNLTTNVSTMFNDANWTRLHDWKVGLIWNNDYNEGGEIRGMLLDNVDGDAKPDIYLAGNNFGAILDIEWDGGTVADLGTGFTVASITNGVPAAGKARIVMTTSADADSFAAGDKIQLSGTLDEEYIVDAVAAPNVDLTTIVTTTANVMLKKFVYVADVTVGDDYSYFKTPIVDLLVQGGNFARPANIQIVDMDGDGLQEILAIVPWSGDNPVDNLLGLYVFEQDAESVGTNLALTNVWHEASEAIFKRGYVLTAGGSLRADVDIDKDGKGEFLAYMQDGGEKIVFLFEASADNTWEIVWKYQFSDGTLGLVGGERGIMVTDIDGDNRDEIVVIVDSEDPAVTGGFNAGHIWEWDGLDIDGTIGQGLPAMPTATFDPPRDAIGHVSLENNSLVFDVDNDDVDEFVLTHRGGNGTFLSIISLAPTDVTAGVSGGVTVTVEFEDKFIFVGVDDGPLAQMPREFALSQNYPNPFNPSTIITYDVPAVSDVSISIYDMLGRNVITLVKEQKHAGSYDVEWNGKNSSGTQVTSGIYFYRLEAGQSAITKKMLLLR